MNIDPTTYGYTYGPAIYCPECLVEELLGEGRAAPAAREMGAEEVIEQIVEVEALEYPATHDSQVVPQRLGAYSGLTDEDTCDRCSEVLYQ